MFEDMEVMGLNMDTAIKVKLLKDKKLKRQVQHISGTKLPENTGESSLLRPLWTSTKPGLKRRVVRGEGFTYIEVWRERLQVV